MRFFSLRKLALASGVLLVAACLAAAWTARRGAPPLARHVVRFRVGPGDDAAVPLPFDEMRIILDRRLAALEGTFGLREWTVRPLPPDGVELTFTTQRDPEEVLRWVTMPARVEFRLLHPDPDVLADGAAPPPGNEVVTYAERQYRLSPPREIQLVEHRYAVEQAPALSIAQLSGADFGTRGIEKMDVLVLHFCEEDAAKLARLTALNAGRQMAMLVDGQMFFPPREIESAVTGDALLVKGYFDTAALQKLAAVLDSGPLPARLERITP